VISSCQLQMYNTRATLSNMDLKRHPFGALVIFQLFMEREQ